MEFYEHELMKDMTHRCGKKKNYKFASDECYKRTVEPVALVCRGALFEKS